mmetsp:Transcript_25966/g.35845  ORF Transcript_25966/g.35845 Transcript_25966/m.35845 type:complete len:230 (+) Transcript_25966:63-752(+)|eukprot:CAMPEP_0196579754 /NCGR_PEP_ID=MMETSP1081-20130531/24496_1 /TAXON_ID=36882 /ORGANISM="Pyramimonas amylifera, Strain CCMP720" /LENGTH=229 /DNA_ID=CAMNT_0041899425 /DNA_START=36 /DNA_END=725 /DNA_ORIENTATION=+
MLTSIRNASPLISRAISCAPTVFVAPKVFENALKRGLSDMPVGHDETKLTGADCNIGLQRRRDITLRQDLFLAPACSWDEGVKSGFASSSLADLFKDKKIVLFGVPGAYTGICSQSHVPGYAAKAAEFKAAGVDAVCCVSINDPFTMNAWAEKMGVPSDKVQMLADFNGGWTRSLGLEADLSVALLGMRSQRYSMFIENGLIIKTNIEAAPSDLKVSDADTMLSQLSEK